MDQKKKKICLEIVYNCPFLLLVIFTSLIVLPFLSRNDELKSDKNIAVTRLFEIGQNGEKTADNSPKYDDEASDIELNTDNFPAAMEEATFGETGELSENAGVRKEENSIIENGMKRKNDSMEMENTQKQEKSKVGTTKFVEYTPIETDSRYYSDAGKVALTTDYDYVLENESYFNDAAFLGDSRTLGISDYAGLEGADFFCDNGMTIYKVLEDDAVTYQRTGEKVDLKQIFQEKHYGKVYIMLGMNELGYGDTPMYLRQYREVVRQIKKWQPGVTIYIMANLHVSREKNNMETEFNNININDKNVASARIANGRDVFYLDCNPLFTDAEGYLQADLTFDGVHLYAQHYDKWKEFLFSHGVERDEEAGYGRDTAE